MSDPEDLGGRAAKDLRFIRESMERAGSFTAVSGWGQVAVGILGLGGSWWAMRQETDRAQTLTWIGTAIVAVLVDVLAIAIKARRSGVALGTGVTRQFLHLFLPPLGAAAVLTWVLWRADRLDLVIGMWLLLYGVAVFIAGAYSIRIVPAMGLCFALLGIATFLSPPEWGNAYMAAGFGLVHIGFGVVIARRYGG